MPALARLVEQGQTATLYSVDPPLPEAALNALVSGATDPNAEPIWQTAARHQRTTALLFWPRPDPARPDPRADYTLACTPPLVPAGPQTVRLSPGELWPGAPAGFGPPYTG